MNSRPVAFITGASRGIGAATARAMTQAGYDCALLSNEPDALAQVAEECRQLGGTVLALQGDLADLEFVRSSVETCHETYGRIDVLVNNAAWREIVTMKRITPESWEKTLRICLTTPAFLARWCAEKMEPVRKGVILNLSSIQSHLPAGISPAYVAAKGGLDALTYELATLYGPAGIRVLSINPGAIDTELSRNYAKGNFDERMRAHVEGMIPLQRFGTADEIARMLVVFASDASSYLTGTCIDIDGGWVHQGSPYGLKHELFPADFPAPDSTETE